MFVTCHPDWEQYGRGYMAAEESHYEEEGADEDWELVIDPDCPPGKIYISAKRFTHYD